LTAVAQNQSNRARRCASGIVAVLLLGFGAAAANAFAPGAAGVGDPFFPKSGNGGYDVGHYALDFDYAPQTGKLDATALITATAVQELSRFDLDFRGPRVRAVNVDGQPGGFKRAGQELIITPTAPILQGAQFTVEVAYRGRPKPLVDADGSKEGWVPTDDGAFVVGEPHGSPTWFPCNDHPTDKATFEFRVTVPHGTEAVANGALLGRRRHGSRVTWSYAADQPMASYLATAAIGNFRLQRSSFDGIESLVALDPREAKASKRPLSKIKRMTRFFGTIFGPYPFGQTGAIVDRAPDVGYALETQTRPIYDQTPDEVTVAHELAHQWFGDSVSVQRWKDIWLNEGFATWAEWRWAEEAGGDTTAQVFRKLERTAASRTELWDPPPGALTGPAQLFDSSVYVRGGMALEALRQRVGDAAFFATLRAWTSEHAYGNATIEQFIALAEAQSGEDLGALFQKYLYQSGKP
jgi:aminopeptidase N